MQEADVPNQGKGTARRLSVADGCYVVGEATDVAKAIPRMDARLQAGGHLLQPAKCSQLFPGM
eukprot:2169922-Prorocentrum_lima.AAC.1